MRFIIKYLVLFLLFVALHYSDGLPPIAGLNFAQITRIPILLYLLYFVLFSKRGKTSFEKTGYAYSLEPFLCPSLLTNPFSIVVFASKQLPMILSYNFWLTKFYRRKEKLEYIMYGLAQFVALTSLLTLTGILEPLKGYKSAESYIDDMVYYSSLFGATHAASSFFAISIIILIYGLRTKWFNNRNSRLFNYFLLAILFVSLFKSFVRTGWIMTIIGVIVLYFEDLKTNLNRLLRYIIIFMLAVGVGGTYLYNNNEAFRMRLTGETKFHEGNGGIDINGSGRTDFWVTGIENWAQNDFYGMLFGKGYDAVRADNLRTNGIEVFSHNQFVDSLCQYGIISLILLILYYWRLYKFIRGSSRNNSYKTLALSTYIISLVFVFFQNELYFDFAILVSLCMSLLVIEETTIKSPS